MKAGEFIRHARKKKNVTARELANHAGLDHTYISKLENGKVPNKPSLEALKFFSEYLSVPLEQLLTAYGKCLHCGGTGDIDRREV